MAKKYKVIPKKGIGLSPSKCITKTELKTAKRSLRNLGYKLKQFKIVRCK